MIINHDNNNHQNSLHLFFCKTRSIADSFVHQLRRLTHITNMMQYEIRFYHIFFTQVKIIKETFPNNYFYMNNQFPNE